MSLIEKISIPIKMGSKQFKINHEFGFNNFLLNTSQLIEIVLRKIQSKYENIGDLIKSYSVYESISGVERLVGKNENIINLVVNQQNLNSNVYFIIRKKTKIVVSKTQKKSNLDAKKCYRKLQSQKVNELRVFEDEEKIDNHEPELIKNVYLKQIFQNEIILNNQMQKLQLFDKILTNQKVDNNTSNSKNIFQSIYNKFKQQNRSNLNHSSTYLIDSDGNCSSNSSSPSTSSSKLNSLF
ncbi:unnamed protein product [Brachionus calyciflorus]|uniref:Uncharacterized protein n=1 Tax=Brachionus calyciflorus TaxID=104777 RepID=A0A813Z5Y6_9BILA|nr:unnamed protein product [Brachionus calyciflorus]